MIVDVKNIKFNPSNPRKLKQNSVFEKLKQSILDFPKMLEKRPLVCVTDDNGGYVVLGGNQRLKALKELKVKQVNILLADDWTEDERQKFIIADNASAGEWDKELMTDWQLEEAIQWGEIEFNQIETELEAKEDDYTEPENLQVDVVLGDLIDFVCNDGRVHRLLCGDSTDSDAVAKLMDDKKADMVFTDPPYDLEDLSFTDNLFMFTDGHLFILNSEQRNVDISAKHRDLMTRWYAVDFRQAHLVSNNCPMTRVDFIAEFRNSEKVKFNNTNDGFTTLIECCKIHSTKGETIHKQEKKIELPAKFIEHFSNLNNIILDFFLGSGTTLVASHQLNRICYGMELDPKYCQVIIDRMQKLDSSIVVKINGNEYKTLL